MTNGNGILKRDRCLPGLIGVLILAGTVLTGCAGDPPQRNNQPAETERITELWSLTVGMTKADVSLAKGEPSMTTRSNMIYSSLKQGKRQLHFVTFDDQGALRNVCTSRGDTHLLGLRIGDTESQLLDKLGPPKLVRRAADEQSKRVYYPRFGISFGIEADEINLICIGRSYRENAASANGNIL